MKAKETRGQDSRRILNSRLRSCDFILRVRVTEFKAGA